MLTTRFFVNRPRAAEVIGQSLAPYAGARSLPGARDIFSAPVAYLFRPYIVYRSRDEATTGELVGTAPRRRGW